MVLCRSSLEKYISKPWFIFWLGCGVLSDAVFIFTYLHPSMKPQAASGSALPSLGLSFPSCKAGIGGEGRTGRERMCAGCMNGGRSRAVPLPLLLSPGSSLLSERPVLVSGFWEVSQGANPRFAGDLRTADRPSKGGHSDPREGSWEERR